MISIQLFNRNSNRHSHTQISPMPEPLMYFIHTLEAHTQVHRHKDAVSPGTSKHLHSHPSSPPWLLPVPLQRAVSTRDLKGMDCLHLPPSRPISVFPNSLHLGINSQNFSKDFVKQYWVGQKVRLCFSVISYGKTQTNFWANPMKTPIPSLSGSKPLGSSPFPQ